MVIHNFFNLNANEDFVMFLISKLITCFIDAFTLGMKSQSIALLLSESAHIYRRLIAGWANLPNNQLISKKMA